ncbi:hypothetical protein JCM19274_1075 [Algibacter lectus]|uniref:HEPN AbiU2-like domain-containing protein n=1 Tax=Algibacter lectus TaxID=221126 RepID=A0A090WNM7_9FLAO|nr:hypothetical protein [Algibacter lectus]GAL78611.1 hypothetical protein JCM19274_1075 [Algibacter lectus]
MSQNNIPDHLKKRYHHVYSAFHLCNTSLTETKILNLSDFNPKELELVNGHTFKYFRVTLQYSYIMEYHNLLEKGRKNSSEHISSLVRLNEALKNTLGPKFNDRYQENITLIEELKSSLYLKKLQDLRDKKFAHSEKNPINEPFKIKGLNEGDISNGIEHLSIMREIIKNCTSPYGFDYKLETPSSENRTLNFIKFQSKYKQFYFENQHIK